MRRIALVLALVLVPGALAGSSGWQRLPAAPIHPDGYLAGAWTGRQLVVFGRAHGAPEPQLPVGKAFDVAAAYSPAQRAWRLLDPPAGPDGSYDGGYRAVWTGKEVLAWGPFDALAYAPKSGRWRKLPRPKGIGNAPGIAVWTGRELVGWGGGCCGDAFSSGLAYSPAADRWRPLARSPLAGSQHPVGAWTGRELVLLVGDLDPDGKPLPARLARAAAYDPRRDTWRRIARPPQLRPGAVAAWDGREVLLVGGTGAAPGSASTLAFAYDPVADRWRRLRPLPFGRVGAAAVWTGKRLLVVGGTRGERRGRPLLAHSGLAYDPASGRWSQLPRSPISGRIDPVAAWTGNTLLVWGGASGTAAPSRTDGALLTP